MTIAVILVVSVLTGIVLVRMSAATPKARSLRRRRLEDDGLIPPAPGPRLPGYPADTQYGQHGPPGGIHDIHHGCAGGGHRG
jgi:hypothetical protein